MNAEERFLHACRREPVDVTPVWFMRQAGRYLPEYRAIRERHTLLEICSNAELSAEVTLQPIERFGVDAAIIFADILLPLVPMGMHLEFAAGEGPVLHNPLRDLSAIQALRLFDPEDDLAPTLAAIAFVRRELAGRAAVIGFAGGPFTVASYAIEGGSSRDFRVTKTLMYQQPDAWELLMDKLATVTARYMRAQVHAGAQCVQLFDSWAGALAPLDYRRYVLPATQRIVAEVRAEGAPVIVFGTNTAGMLDALADAGSDVVGVDWRVPLDVAWDRIGPNRAIQGNLDPIALFAPREVLAERVADILRRANGRHGHIFNLGHGIVPGTPVDAVAAVVDMVHGYSGGGIHSA